MMASATWNIIDSQSQEIPAKFEIYPGMKGREHLYGWYPPGYNTLSIPSYKIPSTYVDELNFNSIVKENLTQSFLNEDSLPPSETLPTEEAVIRHDINSKLTDQACQTAPGSKTEPFVVAQPPTIRTASRSSTENPSKPRFGLQARLEAIRLDLMNRQRQAPPLMRATSSQGKPQFAMNRRTKGPRSASNSVSRPIFNPVPAEWINRIPEPDLRFTRSPKQSRPSSRQSSASLNRSMTLPTPTVPGNDVCVADNPQISSQERPPSPTLTNQKWVSPPSLTNRTSLPVRPKTAPTSLTHRKLQMDSNKSTPTARPQPSNTTQQHKLPLSRSYCIEASGGLDFWLQGQKLSRYTKATPTKEDSLTPKRPKTAHAKVDLLKSNNVLPQGLIETEATNGEEIKLENEIFSETTDGDTRNDEPFNERLVIKDLLEDEYTKQLNKHGWKLEIPFDPLGLKGPLIPGRSSCSVKLVEPEILPQPPPMYKENRDTFFHNVMPNKRLTFEISPDFMSERYNKAKDEMRKRGLWNYSSKSFSFLY